MKPRVRVAEQTLDSLAELSATASTQTRTHVSLSVMKGAKGLAVSTMERV